MNGASAVEQHSGSATFSVERMPALSMEITESNLQLPIVPTSKGQFGRVGFGVKVTSSSDTGYTLTMQSSSDKLVKNGERPSVSNSITSITQDYTCDNEELNVCTDFPVNSWGFRTNKLTAYKSVADAINSSVVLNSTDTTNNGVEEETTIYLAAKLNSQLPVGIYDGVSLTFVATANPEPMTSIDSVLFMQDFARLSEEQKQLVLESMEEEKQYVKTDARDGKDYYISKLKDGHVWMTQNLDFDITEETKSKLTSQYTNLTVESGTFYGSGYSKDPDTGIITWAPAASATTIMTGRDLTGTNGEINNGTNAGKWANNDSTPYSVSVGDWYETGNYFASSVCNDVSWSVGCNFLNKAKTTAQDGVTLLDNYWSTKQFETNDAHGSIGNHYNWNAAIASNGTSGVSSGEAANSICPAGWGLPKSTDYTTLNTTYNSTYSSGNQKDFGLMAAPWYGVRGGFVYTNSSLSTLYDAGRLGNYWSSTASGATTGYNLYFYSSGVNPADSVSRGVGSSVRCIAL